MVIESPLPVAIESGKAPVSYAQLAPLYGDMAEPVPEFTASLTPNCSVPTLEAKAVPPIAVIVAPPQELQVSVVPLIVIE